MIEDNGNDELLVKLALERQSTRYELIIARDGLEAVACLKACRNVSTARSANFSLVLLDLKLPKLNGLEVLRRIRADTSVKSTPVVVWTSSCEPADLITAYELGCNSYVQKPVNFGLFCNALTQITSYWFDLNRGPQAVI
jgi:two-component system, response regulator